MVGGIKHQREVDMDFISPGMASFLTDAVVLWIVCSILWMVVTGRG